MPSSPPSPALPPASSSTDVSRLAESAILAEDQYSQNLSNRGDRFVDSIDGLVDSTDELLNSTNGIRESNFGLLDSSFGFLDSTVAFRDSAVGAEVAAAIDDDDGAGPAETLVRRRVG